MTTTASTITAHFCCAPVSGQTPDRTWRQERSQPIRQHPGCSRQFDLTPYLPNRPYGRERHVRGWASWGQLGQPVTLRLDRRRCWRTAATQPVTAVVPGPSGCHDPTTTPTMPGPLGGGPAVTTRLNSTFTVSGVSGPVVSR